MLEKEKKKKHEGQDIYIREATLFFFFFLEEKIMMY